MALGRRRFDRPAGWYGSTTTVMLRRHLLLVLCLGAAAVVLYRPTLDHGFVYDDLWNIQENRALRTERLDVDSLVRAARGAPGMANRPVSNLSFALNFYLSRPDPGPRAYRWTNILIHAGNGALIYGLLVLTLGLAAEGPRRPEEAAALSWLAQASFVVPFVAAMLWLVHPIQTQSVTYLHQRMTSLATFFLLGTLFAYVVGRRTGSLWRRRSAFLVSALCAGLALGTKEVAAVLPVVVLLYEWTFLRDMKLRWLRENREYLAFAVVLMSVIGLLYLRESWDWIEGMYSQLPYSPGQRLLTQLRVVVFGLSLLLIPQPSRLNVDHDFVVSISLVEPLATLFSLGVLVVLLGIAVHCARLRLRCAFFGLLWLFISQLIESSVIPVEMVSEHRLYLPSVGLAFVLLELASIQRRGLVRWIWCAGAVLGVVFCGWTLERNHVWKDETSLWLDAVEKSPHKVRPGNNLGRALARRGGIPEAVAQFRRVLTLQPGHPEANSNLGGALLAQGKTEEAIRYLRVATRGKKDLVAAQHTLGLALLRIGDYEEAERRLSQALALSPGNPEIHYELGNALQLQRKTTEAERHYLFSLGQGAEFVRKHYELAGYLVKQGKPAQAMPLYETILRVQPDNVIVHTQLGVVLAQLERLEEAVRYAEQALALNPEFEPAQLLLEELVGALEKGSRG